MFNKKAKEEKHQWVYIKTEPRYNNLLKTRYEVAVFVCPECKGRVEIIVSQDSNYQEYY